MALDDDIRTLSGVGLFEVLTAEQLRLLAFGAENMQLSAGSELYLEGQKADCAYVVAQGRIVLFRQKDGEQQILAELEDGAILGEMALIADTKRLTGARAEIDTDIIRLNRSLFRRILEEYPDVAASLHRRISHDLETMIRKIGALGSRFS
jgi:CRP-like cAMP-binding protein